MIRQIEIHLPAFKRGFHLVTHFIEQHLNELPKQGIAHLFLKHTSAALTINENADPSVRRDLDNYFDRIAPENQSYFDHNEEGPDDMPAHIKASLIGSSVTIPITNHQLNLGTWQGIFLCEFRNHASSRKVVITIMGE